MVNLSTHTLQYLPRPNGTARVYVMLGEGKLADDQNVDAMDTISKVSKIVGCAARIRRFEQSSIIYQVLRRGFEPYKMEIQDPTWCTVFQGIYIDTILAHKQKLK